MKIILILMMLLLPSPPVWADCGNVCVTRAKGEAIVMRGDQKIAMEEGTQLESGDRVILGKDSGADLAMYGIAGGRILEGSELQVENTEPEAMKYMLKSGKAIFNIDRLKEKSKFEVQTPTAIASVRGTQFMAQAISGAGEAQGSFVVRDGSVEVFVMNSEQVFTLNEGQALDVPLNPDQPLAVREAQSPEMAVLDQASTVSMCSA